MCLEMFMVPFFLPADFYLFLMNSFTLIISMRIIQIAVVSMNFL